MRNCCVRELGRIGYGDALALQQQLVSDRKQALVPDHLLLLEHPHVITLGRNGHMENLLAGDDILSRAGIEFHPTDRGGDVTYHGPGQLVGYPILDLREWKRDVGAYVRGLEQAIIDTLADYGIEAGRIPKLTGVWVDGRKIAAIGVHLSRWVTSHGFALNVNTDLSYFQYIVPCGLTKPVTSMAQLGVRATVDEVAHIFTHHFARVFGFSGTGLPARAAERSSADPFMKERAE
jgi:lipoyl(octanoyl) transferase